MPFDRCSRRRPWGWPSGSGFEGTSTRDCRSFRRSAENPSQGNLGLFSLGNGVFVDNAVLHDDQKLVRWVSNEVYIFQRIAVDD
jgi:hypothetical protein